MRRQTIFWALALIGLGVFLLLREIFESWEDVSPGGIILIALGLFFLLQRPGWGFGRGGVLPLALLAIGVMLLLRDLDVIREDVSFWPVVLIVVGVGILFAALASGRGPRATGRTIRLDGAASARVSMRHGAGRLIVGPLGNPDLLLDGGFTGDVDAAERRRGDRLEVSLKQGRPRGWGWRGFEWAVSLNRNVPLSLDVGTGGSSARLELEDLLVPELSVQAGASQLEVTVPARGHTTARIRVGAAQLKVRIPPGVAGMIRSRTGLASTSVDATRFPRIGDAFQSPDYETAENRVDLEIEGGAADVSVS